MVTEQLIEDLLLAACLDVDNHERLFIPADACEELGDEVQAAFWRWAGRQYRRPWVQTCWRTVHSGASWDVRSVVPKGLLDETPLNVKDGDYRAAWVALLFGWRSLWREGAIGPGRDPERDPEGYPSGY
jgi:hypothetical protein